jgi:hypothetical protein
MLSPYEFNANFLNAIENNRLQKGQEKDKIVLFITPICAELYIVKMTPII